MGSQRALSSPHWKAHSIRHFSLRGGFTDRLTRIRLSPFWPVATELALSGLILAVPRYSQVTVGQYCKRECKHPTTAVLSCIRIHNLSMNSHCLLYVKRWTSALENSHVWIQGKRSSLDRNVLWLTTCMPHIWQGKKKTARMATIIKRNPCSYDHVPRFISTPAGSLSGLILYRPIT
jgi:hypothetical protein